MIVLNNYAVFSVNTLEPFKDIPGVKTTVWRGRNYVAMPDTVDYHRIAANMGLKVSSPILRNYDWPLKPGWEPGWWQQETAAFMTLNPRAHVNNAMRTRKTMSTLWAVDYLQRTGAINRVLIVAPLSSLELAWADSMYFNLPRKKYAVLHGTKAVRKKLLEEKKDVYIINHDGVEVILEDLMKRTDIDCIVVDESHEYKNVRTHKWQALNALINKRGGLKYVWGLTGTPTPQAPTDAYGQSKLITPSSYTGSFTRFKSDTMFQVSPFRFIPRKGSEAIVAKALHPSIRFDRSVVTDLEPCMIERHAELSKEQHHHYTKLKKEAVTEINGVGVSAVNAAVLCGKIAQCSCGVIYGEKGEFLRIDFGPRLKVLEELIEENDEKVLVFIPFTGALDAVANELKKRWSVAVVDGSVNPTKRDKIFRAFQTEKDPHVIVAHPNTMAYSLELTAASLCVWYAPPTTGNKIYQQACARIDGGHQKNKMDIAHISGTPEERKMYDVLQGRAKWQDILLDLCKKG